MQGGSPTAAGACSVYFDFPATSGAMPIARAAAAAASVADRLYVYGGVGVDNQPLSDMYIFDAGAGPSPPWRRLSGKSPGCDMTRANVPPGKC